MPGSPRSPPGSKIFLTNVGSGRGRQYLLAGVKLRARSPGHLDGGANPEQQPQEPERAPLGSPGAPGRGMEAAPRLCHSDVLGDGSSGSGAAAAAATAGRRRKNRGGRFSGGGCKGLGSLRSPPCGYAEAAHPSSSLLPLRLLPTSPWQPPPLAARGWVGDHEPLRRSPAGRHGSRRRGGCARRGSATGPTGGRRGRAENAVAAAPGPPPESPFPLLFRAVGHLGASLMFCRRGVRQHFVCSDRRTIGAPSHLRRLQPWERGSGRCHLLPQPPLEILLRAATSTRASPTGSVRSLEAGPVKPRLSKECLH